MSLDYETWIRRERKIRIRILKSSPQIQTTRVYRVCRDCAEVCLCHEEICPNCGGVAVAELKLGPDEILNLEARIRCRERFASLEAGQ
jgi:hypothetical protein